MQFSLLYAHMHEEAGEVRKRGLPSDQASLMPSVKTTTTYIDRCAADDLDYSDSDRSSCCNIDMPQLLQFCEYVR
jgi:hypothetical protein